MTAKRILDAFSETLMLDERILSSRERELHHQHPADIEDNFE